MDLLRYLKKEDFRTFCLTVLSGVFLAFSFMHWSMGLPFDLAWLAIFISGIPIVNGAVKGLVTEFDVTADVLVAIALIAAVFIGEYFAAGEVAFIMQLGKVLEDVTAGKAHNALEKLIRLAPQKATRRIADREEVILASEIQIEDVILVRPGEVIPVDGKIRRGDTSVDQSLMTGESFPVDRSVGDLVYQGTLNQQGVIELEATHRGDDSSLEKMIHLVEEAEQNKAPIVGLANRWARILVPVALGCSLFIWFLTKDIHRTVAALVVFCPCSLILATPTAMMAAIGNATKNGILIKSGAAVEAISKMDTLVMDKTGTLTTGTLGIEAVYLLDQRMELAYFLNQVGSAEKFSEHPIGKAIYAYCQSQGIQPADPDRFEMKAGKGVLAVVGGIEVRIGEKIISDGGRHLSPEAMTCIHTIQNAGKTALPVSINHQLVGVLSIADGLRKETKEAVAALKQSGISRLILLTGDHLVVAEAIGREAGITNILASQLPEDKVNAIKQLREKGYTVGMIGDGMNDAPALATASVGIVMGAIGSDIAIEAADIALMGDDLSKLSFLVLLSRLTRRRILFNISFSMLLNFGAILLAGLGILNPVMAAIVHNFGSVFVVVSSAMLLSYTGQKTYV